MLRKVLKFIMYFVIIGTIFWRTIDFVEASVINEEESGQALNQLGLVQGSGGDYHISSQLTRAEAITLILRLTKTQDLADTSLDFSDVAANDWFYSAVSQGVELGIVNGYPDGTFRPNDHISRQAFLKMLLEVLGYSYNTDYDWNSVNTFSYSVGLINRLENQGAFLRKDAFDIMTRLLNSTYNMSSTSYIEKMVNDGILTSEQKDAFDGLYSFDKYSVKVIKSPSEGVVLIEMNRRISDNVGQIQVELASNGAPLTDLTTSFSDNLIVLRSNELIQNQEYQLRISGILDDFDIPIRDIEKTMTYETLPEAFDLFIESMEINSSRHILVTFSEPMPDEVFVAASFTVWINGDRKFVGLEKLSTREALIVLREDVSLGDSLKVSVMGSLESLYGFSLYDGYTFSQEIIVDLEPINELRVESIEPIGNGVVELTFNMPVDQSDGEDYNNYQINDLSEGRPYMTSSRSIAVGVDEYKNRKFHIVYSRFIDGNLYYLKTTGVKSLGGGYSLESQQYRFTYIDNASSFGITSLEALDSNHFVATFNQPLDEQRLLASSMEIGGYDVYKRHMDSDDANKVHLYMLNPLEAKKTYYLKVENLKSLYDMEIDLVSKAFTSSSIERDDVTWELDVLDDGRILIRFNRDFDSFVKNGTLNIGILEKDNPVARNLDKSDYTIVDASSLIIPQGIILADDIGIKFGSLYLQGDGYYIGNLTVELAE